MMAHYFTELNKRFRFGGRSGFGGYKDDGYGDYEDGYGGGYDDYDDGYGDNRGGGYGGRVSINQS